MDPEDITGRRGKKEKNSIKGGGERTFKGRAGSVLQVVPRASNILYYLSMQISTQFSFFTSVSDDIGSIQHDGVDSSQRVMKRGRGV